MKRLIFILTIILATASVFSQDYFPTIKGSFWTYHVYQDGVFSYIDSVVYNNSIKIDDTTFYSFVHYYKEGNNNTFVTNYLYDNFSDNNTIMLSNRNLDVIDSAVYAKHTYVDGEWWIAHKIPQDDTIRVKLVGDITVTAGTFNNCVEQGEEYIFAPNVGIIKIKLWNATSYYDLVNYHIPDAVTAISEKTNQNIRVFPHPSGDYICILNMDKASYKIVSLNGKVIKTGVVTNAGVDIINLKPGIYILNLTREGKQNNSYFIKN